MTMFEDVGCTLNFRGVYMRVVETYRGGWGGVGRGGLATVCEHYSGIEE